MSKIILINGPKEDYAFLHPTFAPVRTDDLLHAVGDYDVLFVKGIAAVSLVEGTFKSSIWLQQGFVVLKLKPIAEFNLNSPEPVPGGAMKSSWQHGKEAFAAGADIDSYQKDKGTAPHTVWVKGYLWAYLKEKV